MYCCSDLDEKEKSKFSCEGFQRDKIIIIIIIKRFIICYLINIKIKVVNKDFRYINGTMKSYEQVKKGLSYAYQKHNCL